MHKSILAILCLVVGAVAGVTSIRVARAFPDDLETPQWAPACPTGFELTVDSYFKEKDGDFSAVYTCERGPINCRAPVGASVSSSLEVDSPVVDPGGQTDYYLTLDCFVQHISDEG